MNNDPRGGHTAQNLQLIRLQATSRARTFNDLLQPQTEYNTNPCMGDGLMVNEGTVGGTRSNNLPSIEDSGNVTDHQIDNMRRSGVELDNDDFERE